MIVWTQSKDEWLLILRDVLCYSYSDCADNMNREYKQHYFSRNACIGRYRVLREKRYGLLPKTINEVLKAAKE